MEFYHKEARDLNRDPISGATGAHPVGVGVGEVVAGGPGALGAIAVLSRGSMRTHLDHGAAVVVAPGQLQARE